MGFPLFLSLLASLGTGWAQVCDHNETCDAVDTSLIQTDSTERKQGRKHGRHGRSLQPSLLQSDQAILNEAQVQALKRPDRWHGVNYGNRFVPEDWIEYPYNFFENVTKFGPRVALWDLPPGQASKERMLTWLETSIQESHFAEMQRMAVELMRLPVGYWNFVTYPENTGPVVPQHFEERVKNLHKIATPEEYRPYLDKVFNWASKYGIKVLLDFHALPGSQNGEIHSGVCMRDSAGKNTDFFQNDANAAKALETIREMARYTKDKDALWGIQVINEPHLFNSEEHSFLKNFFEDACKLIRDEGIAMEKPCVVFSWTYDMDKWIDWNNPMFPKETYGRVIFDTHLYHFPDGTWTLDQAKASYKDDLISTRRFFLDAQIDLIVGEYTLAGTGLGPSDQKAFAQWLVDEFDFTAVGSIFWTFDCQHDDWSLVKTDHNVNWAQIWRSDRDDCISYNQINLQSADWRFLSKGGGENPKMKPSAQNWEVWHTCYQKEPAQTPGAVKMSFRSIADGGYLSVTSDRQVRGSWIRQGWETFEALCDAQARCKLKSFHGTWLSPSANYEDPDVWAVAADPPNAPQWHAISH